MPAPAGAADDRQRCPRVRARFARLWLAAAFFLAPAVLAQGAGRVLDQPGAADFLAEVSRRHGYPQEELEALFGRAEVLPSVLTAISRPAEAKPWYEYRRIFLTPERVEGGVAFWLEQAAALERASAQFGVPPEVIVAIIGVETRYGRNTGSFRVLEALATLAFNYPRRAEFFRKELESFLVLAREEGIPALDPKGSYAGAMGIPQFMPSSYRRYAVDLDADGRRDLWRNPTDAIGSVANYLRAHGWERNGVVALPATVTAPEAIPLLKAGLKPSLTADRLASEGVRVNGEMPPDGLAALIQLETQEGYEYWVGLQNFYAITRYNHSPLYAMAVHLLAQQIKAAYAGRKT
ncbi:MAG: lytic murein transglycosylase B [Gammaproteobacteria bacterium]|nr:lytic murein transglycosylase B [Gammaproteobacteria bacterium]